MPTAIVAYCSSTWTTAGLADEIAAQLRDRGIDTTVASVDDLDPATVGGTDLLLLGAWTHGWFVVRQHPDRPWVDFARALPPLAGTRIGLFTTYRIATGSMFRRMRRELVHCGVPVELELKARGPHLTNDGRRAVDRFLGPGQALSARSGTSSS